MNDQEIIGLVFSLLGCVIGVVFLVLYVVVAWRIFAKAGYSGALGLLMLIPIVNLIAICVLAFAEWPIERELKNLRATRGQSTPAQTTSL